MVAELKKLIEKYTNAIDLKSYEVIEDLQAILKRFDIQAKIKNKKK